MMCFHMTMMVVFHRLRCMPTYTWQICRKAGFGIVIPTRMRFAGGKRVNNFTIARRVPLGPKFSPHAFGIR